MRLTSVQHSFIDATHGLKYAFLARTNMGTGIQRARFHARQVNLASSFCQQVLVKMDWE
jgi:hypothetical protein